MKHLKTMKKLLFLLMLAVAVAGCKSDDEATPNVYEDSNVPPYAASKKVWTLGNQTWSDAIHCPECNKATSEDSSTDPQCRSYTEGGKTWYYYNWPYVNQNAATLCPSPWRVPSASDFTPLLTNHGVYWLSVGDLMAAWGGDYGGYANGQVAIYTDSYAYYWSSTEYDRREAYYLGYRSGYPAVTLNSMHYGYQVRCVK
jgi:uncharacterized protein (TIGR02145 family)